MDRVASAASGGRSSPASASTAARRVSTRITSTPRTWPTNVTASSPGSASEQVAQAQQHDLGQHRPVQRRDLVRRAGQLAQLVGRAVVADRGRGRHHLRAGQLEPDHRPRRAGRPGHLGRARERRRQRLRVQHHPEEAADRAGSPPAQRRDEGVHGPVVLLDPAPFLGQPGHVPPARLVEPQLPLGFRPLVLGLRRLVRGARVGQLLAIASVTSSRPTTEGGGGSYRDQSGGIARQPTEPRSGAGWLNSARIPARSIRGLRRRPRSRTVRSSATRSASARDRRSASAARSAKYCWAARSACRLRAARSIRRALGGLGLQLFESLGAFDAGDAGTRHGHHHGRSAYRSPYDER